MKRLSRGRRAYLLRITGPWVPQRVSARTLDALFERWALPAPSQPAPFGISDEVREAWRANWRRGR